MPKRASGKKETCLLAVRNLFVENIRTIGIFYFHSRAIELVHGNWSKIAADWYMPDASSATTTTTTTSTTVLLLVALVLVLVLVLLLLLILVLLVLVLLVLLVLLLQY